MVKDVVILAAGRGSRLDRIDTPKPLASVGGVPISVRLLRQFQDAGIERAVIVVGHRGAEVERVLASHPALDLALQFVHNSGWERGLVSSLLAARKHVTGEFIVAMGDHVFDDATIRSIVSRQGRGEPAMTVDSRIDGVLDIPSAVKVRLEAGTGAGSGRVRACGRGLAAYDAIDAGLFTGGPSLFSAAQAVMRASSHADLSDLSGVLSVWARSTRLGVVQVVDHWHDIDTPSALTHAEMTLRVRQRQAVMRPAADTGPVRATEASTFTFTTGAPTRTEVWVSRGSVAKIASLDLIPARGASSPIFVLTDTTVNALYGDAFVAGLRQRGHAVHKVVMPDGEGSKSLANYAELVERILSLGIDQNSVLVSLGGGAVCNVCGFIAATLYRGVELIHVPTTLMAQVDAAISHKQGINGRRGKNLVGAYHAPTKILVDVDVLTTLSDDRIVDGLAEVIKHALVQDAAYLEHLLAYEGDPHDLDFLESLVRRNIALKCALMATDPKEGREGMVLQYGHTVGHPLEFLSGYTLMHGQAVAIGMVVAARVARALGACDPELVDLHLSVLEHYGLPTQVPSSIATDDILAAMRFNKTFLAEGTGMALASRPGQLWSVDGEYRIPVPDGVLRQAIDASREHPCRRLDVVPWQDALAFASEVGC